MGLLLTTMTEESEAEAMPQVPFHEWDKRLVAYHEAGHVVVAWAEGARNIEVWLQRTDTNDPWNELTWTGRTTMDGEAVSAIVGIAGVVAECIYEDGDISVDSIICQLLEGDVELSDTDWSRTGCRVTDEQALESLTEQAFRILKVRWENVVSVANYLVKDEFAEQLILQSLFEED